MPSKKIKIPHDRIAHQTVIERIAHDVIYEVYQIENKQLYMESIVAYPRMVDVITSSFLQLGYAIRNDKRVPDK